MHNGVQKCWHHAARLRIWCHGANHGKPVGRSCCCALLRRDCDEYKRWKASQDAAASGVEGAVADLTLKDKDGAEIEKQLPGGKVKKKAKPQV